MTTPSDDLAEILTGSPSAPAPVAFPAAASAPATAPDPDLLSLVAQKAAQYNIPADMAQRWVQQESSFDPTIVSKKGAKGLTQLMPDTAAQYGVKNILDPAENVEGGAHYLSDLYAKYGDWPRALAAYNAGPTAVDKAGGIPNFPETQNYVHTIMGGVPPPSSPDDLGGILTGAGAATGSPMTQAEADQFFREQYGDPTWLGTGEVAYAGQPGQIPATLTAGQVRTRNIGTRGHAWDETAPQGSPANPFWQGPGTDPKDAPPGSYFVDPNGKMMRTPGGEPQSSFVKGAEQGLGDVGVTLGKLYPGAGDSEVLNRLEAAQLKYGATYGGDLKSGLGRFTGQVVGSAPLLGAADVAAAPVLRLLGPTGRFLAGTAGRGTLGADAGAMERLGQLGLRTASTTAAGAGEGAIATLPSSSASDVPVPQQMEAGAVGGGVMKNVAGAAASGLRRFVGGPALEGAAPITAQQDVAATARNLPVPVPLSLGQMSGAPAQQMTENAMLRGGSGDMAAGVMRGFRDTQQDAIRGNVDAISTDMAGGPVSPGQGGAAVSERLNTMRSAANTEINSAYRLARDQGENAQLPNAADARNTMLDTLRSNYNLDSIPRVATEVESFGATGTPTAREIFDARTRLSNLTQSTDPVESGAARRAVNSLDGYLDHALSNDLMVGDPNSVQAWRSAIAKRADFGRLFEGDDLIDKLTEPVNRGGGMTLVVPPEEATNYILGRSSLGIAGKQNLGRDLSRLKTVLGPDSDEWNALRSEAFLRIARAGEGPPEAGEPQFSGQNFMKAWQRFNRDNPQVSNIFFTPDEQQTITEFAQTAQRATTPVKGGDNPSNTAITAKGLLQPFFRFLATSGGAGGGAAVGGPVGAVLGAGVGSFLKTIGDVLAAGKAHAATYGAKPSTATGNLLTKGPIVPAVGGMISSRLLGSGAPAQ